MGVVPIVNENDTVSVSVSHSFRIYQSLRLLCTASDLCEIIGNQIRRQ